MTLRFGINSISPVRPLLKPEEVSNCIMEIPQNIQLGLEDNVLTLKAGSVLTLDGSTYATITTSADLTRTLSRTIEGKYLVFYQNGALRNERLLAEVTSGDTEGMPQNPDNYTIYFNTDDKKIYHKETNGMEVWANAAYPLCCLEYKNEAWNFAKDSNGNNMIFNGAGFIGHHVFVLPKVSGLRAFGFNEDGSLKTTYQETNALQLYELPTNRAETYIYIAQANNLVMGSSVEMGYPKYVKEENWCYCNNVSINSFLPLLSFVTDASSIVTSFTIRQPVKKFYQLQE